MNKVKTEKETVAKATVVGRDEIYWKQLEGKKCCYNPDSTKS